MSNTLEKVHIQRFRKLKEMHINVAKRITIISGHNGVGKSTILGLIANGSELGGYKSYFDKIFQSKFNEIFRLDIEKDFTKDLDKKYSVILKYNFQSSPFYKFCTITQHNESKTVKTGNGSSASEKTIQIKRLKIVPRNSDENGKQIQEEISGVKASSKIPIPTLYIGMSRVFPIGESQKLSYELKESTIEVEDSNQMNIWYQEVMGQENIDSTKVIKQNLKDSTKKSIGPAFGDYSYHAVSLGQDSLSTIFTALLSFKKLKRDLNETYSGGILVIDEIDACLHPDAQEKLLNILDRCSKELNLQIICTTHSLTIIKNVLNKQFKTSINTSDHTLYYNVIYIKDTVSPKIMRDPTYKKIKSDMFLKDTLFIDTKQEIKIYFEDDEGLYFFNKISEFTSSLDLDEVNLNKISAEIGCDTLIKLPSKDTYFKSVVIVLDEDVKRKQNYRNMLEDNLNICTLPGSETPEKTIESYLTLLVQQPDHSFWFDNDELTIQYVRDKILQELSQSLDQIAKQEKIREIYKKWFRNYEPIFDKTKLIQYWMNDNPDVIKGFVNQFNLSINYVKSTLLEKTN
ncbi:ATP-binding protein [Psychrobacillus lasiicapitis]|nr:ATP-binding protein [Psychrobacillus lasiicapitis]GGA31402.1 prophage P2a protein 4; AAA ATPase [Psychrobacillus lasiicapitis]